MQQFARVLVNGHAVPVIIVNGEHLDLRSIVADITPEAIASGVLNQVDTRALQPLPGEFSYLAPIDGIRQVAATGFNYRKHIEEFKMQPPTEPEVFMKAVTSLAGPNEPISRGPNPGTKLDWEIELAIVVGREASDIAAADAAGYIFGFVCLNDISNRGRAIHRSGRIW
jgi:2,4-didehydro-3-deoxy-L-rhamnonate hydrolase